MLESYWQKQAAKKAELTQLVKDAYLEVFERAEQSGQKFSSWWIIKESLAPKFGYTAWYIRNLLIDAGVIIVKERKGKRNGTKSTSRKQGGTLSGRSSGRIARS